MHYFHETRIDLSSARLTVLLSLAVRSHRKERTEYPRAGREENEESGGREENSGKKRTRTTAGREQNARERGESCFIKYLSKSGRDLPVRYRQVSL